MADATDSPDLISEIITDHREVLAVFDQLENTRDRSLQRTLTNHVITRLTRHSIAEEQYLYPLVRLVLPDGEEIVRQAFRQHAVARQLMKRVERLDATSPEFDGCLRNLMAVARHHLEDEESDLLPRLRDQCDQAQLVELGARFRQARNTAPTRPRSTMADTASGSTG